MRPPMWLDRVLRRAEASAKQSRGGRPIAPVDCDAPATMIFVKQSVVSFKFVLTADGTRSADERESRRIRRHARPFASFATNVIQRVGQALNGIRSLTSGANRVRQVGVGQLLVLIATLGTALTTWFQFGEMRTQTALTRQTIAATERSLRITEEALRATRDSSDIARRAASAAEQQAGLAQRQLEQGTAQIDVGRDANRLSAEATRMERRAWLTVRTVTLVRLLTRSPAVAQLHIENSSSTPAIETRDRERCRRSCTFDGRGLPRAA